MPYDGVVVDELHSDQQQPYPQSETERTFGDPLRCKDSDDDTEEATDDEVLQQAGVIGGGEAVRSAADEREDEAEEDVGANYLRRQQ